MAQNGQISLHRGYPLSEKWLFAVRISVNDPEPIAFGVSAEANAQMSASHLE